MYRSERNCRGCGIEFIAVTTQQYCTPECRRKAEHERKMAQPGYWLATPKTCRHCCKEFVIPRGSSPNRQHCSSACSRASIKKSVVDFHSRNPEKEQEYRAISKKRAPRDTLVKRLYKKYPDLPTSCEAAGCTEGRVIDLAHKPEFRRNGAHRTLDQYQRHMFWILCPTHHALLDRGVMSVKEMGLR